MYAVRNRGITEWECLKLKKSWVISCAALKTSCNKVGIVVTDHLHSYHLTMSFYGVKCLRRLEILYCHHHKYSAGLRYSNGLFVLLWIPILLKWSSEFGLENTNECRLYMYPTALHRDLLHDGRYLYAFAKKNPQIQVIVSMDTGKPPLMIASY